MSGAWKGRPGLYPLAYRRRYGEEMEALVEEAGRGSAGRWICSDPPSSRTSVPCGVSRARSARRTGCG